MAVFEQTFFLYIFSTMDFDVFGVLASYPHRPCMWKGGGEGGKGEWGRHICHATYVLLGDRFNDSSHCSQGRARVIRMTVESFGWVGAL